MTITVTTLATKNLSSSSGGAFSFSAVNITAGDRLMVVGHLHKFGISTWTPMTEMSVTDDATLSSGWQMVEVSAPSGNGTVDPCSQVCAMSDTLVGTESGVTVSVDIDTSDAGTFSCSVALLAISTSTANDIEVIQSKGYVSNSTNQTITWDVIPTGHVIAAWGADGSDDVTYGTEPTGLAAFYSVGTLSFRNVEIQEGVSTASSLFCSVTRANNGGSTLRSYHALGVELSDSGTGALVAPSVRTGGAGTGFAPATTSYVVDMPSTVESGDLLLAQVSCSDTSSVERTFTPPSGWTSLSKQFSSVNPSYGITTEWFAKDSVDGTEDGTTATWTVDASRIGVAYTVAIADAGSAADIEFGTASSGATANPDPPSKTTTFGRNTPILALGTYAAGDDDATTSAYPSGYTHYQDSHQAGGGTNASIEVGVAAAQTTGTTVNPGAYTLSEAESWQAWTLAIPPSGVVASDTVTPDVITLTAAVQTTFFEAGGVLPDPGVRFVAEGEKSLLDGTWSTATASTCRLLVSAGFMAQLTDAQINALTESDLSEPTFTGYAGEALTSGGWTTTPGTPTTATHSEVSFAAVGDPAFPAAIHGYYVTRNSDGALIYFEIFDAVYAIEGDADSIAFDPAFTIAGVAT